MKDKLLATVRRYGMFSPGDRVAVGVSGGADSMCLLSLLRECAAELAITLTAVHVNHGIRGAEADADEAFTERFCRENGVPFVARRADVPALAARSGESTELCARRVRYEIFRSLGADKIATAHTGTDRVETLLMNLSRGAGLKGLCSIPPVRGNVVRPLFDFTRAETERYCREHGVPFVTDSTNLCDDYTRNRFRHTVIPALTDLNPAFEANALRCLSLLRQDEEYLRSAAKERFDELFDPASRSLPVAGLLAEPESLRGRMLALLAEQAGGDYEYRHLARLAEGGFAPCSVTLPGGGALVSDGERISCRSREIKDGPLPARSFTVREKGETRLRFGRFQLIFSIADIQYPLPENALSVDYAKTGRELTVRGRLPGDTVALPRRGCTKTLKKYFNEIAYPVFLRDAVPVIADDSGLIAVAGLTADASRLPDPYTKQYLMIRTECEEHDE